MEKRMMKTSVMEGRDAPRVKGKIQDLVRSELLTCGTLTLEEL